MFSLLHLFVHRRCLVCGRRLVGTEDLLCSQCFMQLPLAPPEYQGKAGNPIERLFYGEIPLCRAAAYMRYQAGSDSRRVVHSLKYGGKVAAGRILGRLMATAAAAQGFFDDADLLLPIPLSRQRERHRGYNQSLLLAQGVADVARLPIVDDAVERIVDNPTQTGLRGYERKENVQGIFRLRRPERLQGRHVVLIDDVLTTGATLISCGKEIARAVPDVSFSVLVLGLAGRVGLGPADDDAPVASERFVVE